MLPSAQNLNQWLGKDVACQHVVVYVAFAIFFYHHNQVLECLAAVIEDRWRVNSQAALTVMRKIHLVVF